MDEWDEADEPLTIYDVVITALGWFLGVAMDAVVMFIALCVANWFYEAGYTLLALAVLLSVISHTIRDAVRKDG